MHNQAALVVSRLLVGQHYSTETLPFFMKFCRKSLFVSKHKNVKVGDLRQSNGLEHHSLDFTLDQEVWDLDHAAFYTFVKIEKLMGFSHGEPCPLALIQPKKKEREQQFQLPV